MNKKNVLQYIAALVCCFLVGCGIALGLQAYDKHTDDINPIENGQTIDFSAYGFNLTVPEDFSLNDYTTNNQAEGGKALFAGCTYGTAGELYLFCYENESHDDLSSYSQKEVISYYMQAGMEDVRMRTLGGRPFITYRAIVQRDDTLEDWYTYETWDEDIQISFETRMTPAQVLPILTTLTFVNP